MILIIDFLEKGFGGLTGDALLFLTALGSIMGFFLFFGGILITGATFFLGIGGIRTNIPIKFIFIGLFMVIFFGWNTGFHYFGIF
jgi:hypothetical protein